MVFNGIIKSTDGCVVVVLKEVVIHFKYFLVVALYIFDVSYAFVVRQCDFFYPFCRFFFLDGWHFGINGLIGNHNVKDLGEEDITYDNCCNNAGEIGDKSAGNGISGFRDSYTSKINGKDIESGIACSSTNATNMSDKRICSILFDTVNH